MTTFSRSLASFVLLLSTALLLAACGGSDEGSGGGGGDDGGASGGGSGEAKSIFAETCGGCHTLSDAGTSGGVGPNLDELKPEADRVSSAIENGGGGMPPGLLEGEERDAVSEYVAEAAGG